MNRLKYIILHCTATTEGLDVTAEAVRNYHMNIRHWPKPGYSLLFNLSGCEEVVHPFNDNEFVEADEETWGIGGELNAFARHYVYVGGADASGNSKDTLTIKQFDTIKSRLLKDISLHPDILIGGHNQFNQTACPGFNSIDKLKEMGIPEKNILEKKLY